ncbi:MAG: hypothetical protein WC807_09840 [Hyphomicrobium sp.]|jgi:uncharacterized membrane protein
MALITRLTRINWRIVGAAVAAMGVLHIITTLTIPALTPRNGYDLISKDLPLNQMHVLPPVTPGTQRLPFLAADARYALCRFDSTDGAVSVSAILPGPGWVLALYTPEGDNFFTTVARPGASQTVSLLLMPTDERTPETSGPQEVILRVTARRGLAMVRSPEQGLAYRVRNISELKQARCGFRKR